MIHNNLSFLKKKLFSITFMEEWNFFIIKKLRGGVIYSHVTGSLRGRTHESALSSKDHTARLL